MGDMLLGKRPRPTGMPQRKKPKMR